MGNVHRAHMTTKKFEFEAYSAVDEASARHTLIAGLNEHARQYKLAADWWNGHFDLNVETFKAGLGYRDHTAVWETSYGGRVIAGSVVRATVDTDKFSFEAYGPNTKDARATMLHALTLHGNQYELKEGWWKGHFDLNFETFKLETCYREHEAMKIAPAPVAEDTESLAPKI